MTPFSTAAALRRDFAAPSAVRAEAAIRVGARGLAADATPLRPALPTILLRTSPHRLHYTHPERTPAAIEAP